MSKPLTSEQLEALRALPLGGMPNRLRVAIALAKVKQADIVDEVGIAAPNLSKLVGGKYTDVTIATAQKLADFFGCAIEDLFPAVDDETTPTRKAASAR